MAVSLSKPPRAHWGVGDDDVLVYSGPIVRYDESVVTIRCSTVYGAVTNHEYPANGIMVTLPRVQCYLYQWH